jgi:NADH:ubiquinone oxidoreductase subunit E
VHNQCRSQLGIAVGQTTADRQFHLDTVRCLGCCGLAPALVVVGRTCAHVKPADVAAHIAAIKAPKGVAA